MEKHPATSPRASGKKAPGATGKTVKILPIHNIHPDDLSGSSRGRSLTGTAFLSPSRQPGRSSRSRTRRSSTSPGRARDLGRMTLDLGHLGIPEEDDVESLPGTPTRSHTDLEDPLKRHTNLSGSSLNSSKKFKSMEFDTAIPATGRSAGQLSDRVGALSRTMEYHRNGDQSLGGSPRSIVGSVSARSGSHIDPQQLSRSTNSSKSSLQRAGSSIAMLVSSGSGEVAAGFTPPATPPSQDVHNGPMSQKMKRALGDDLYASLGSRAPSIPSGLGEEPTKRNLRAESNPIPVHVRSVTRDDIKPTNSTPVAGRHGSMSNVLAPVQEYDDIPNLEDTARSTESQQTGGTTDRYLHTGRPQQLAVTRREESPGPPTPYPTPIGAAPSAMVNTGYTVDVTLARRRHRTRPTRSVEEDQTPKALRRKLHRAVTKNSRLDVLKYLSKGAHIDCRDSYLNTALLLAARDGNEEMFAMLLDMGANPLAVNKAGYTLGHWAALNGHSGIIRIGLRHGFLADVSNNYGNSPLYLAAWHNHVEVARALVDEGANVDVINQDKMTPLHIAAQEGNREIVKLLLDANADHTVYDGNGKLPIEVATRSCRRLLQAADLMPREAT